MCSRAATRWILWLTSRENSESVVCEAKPSLKLERVRGWIWLRYAPLLTRSINPPLTRLCDSLKHVVLLKPVRSTNCLRVTTSSGKWNACNRRQALTTASTISGSLDIWLRIEDRGSRIEDRGSIPYLRSSIFDLRSSICESLACFFRLLAKVVRFASRIWK